MTTPKQGIDLREIDPGFADPALGSQAAFRAVLEALSNPGRIVAMPALAPAQYGASEAAAQALLALLDQDCTLWVSPQLAGSPAVAWLRFHTGCRMVARPAEAQFAWIAAVTDWPGLDVFAQGSECEPEHSTTCVLQVEGLADDGGWTLSGPGIDGTRRLAVRRLGADFAEAWRANRARFPQGVDMLFTAGARLAGLPRTTHIATDGS